MESKDLFSDQSKLYAAFRPTYPDPLFNFIFHFLKEFDCAWDCATGNGQVARRLAERFKKVYASDISEKQLQQAYKANNIFYSTQKAEHTTFADHTFNLITVGQALHWFNLPEFYKEVNRVGKPGGLLAVWGYGNIVLRPEVHEAVEQYYHQVVGEFWEPARKMVETHYADIAFPFELIPSPGFTIEKEWNVNHLLGYVESWSATQAYIKHRGHNPVEELRHQLAELCSKDELLDVEFPVFLKLGRIRS